MVCSQQGKKKIEEEDRLNASKGFSMKRRRLTNRCGFLARISFRYFCEDGVPGYKIHEFVETHNHTMVEVQHQPFMTIN